MRQLLILLAVCVGMWMLPSNASAQLRPKVQLPNTTRAPTAPNYNTVRQGQQAYMRRPSVSPYLNLLNNNGSDVTNYQSLVRPMVNQNRINAQQSAQINRLQAKPPTSSNAGSEALRSTGHQSTYHYYSHYYPNLR